MVSFEPISQSNIDAIAKLANALWPDSSIAEMSEHFHHVFENPRAAAYLALEESAPVGFIELSTRTDYVEGANDSPVAYIEGIYVAPKFQKQSIARKLVELAEDWARQQGFRQLCSDTELENEDSIQFHQAVGFEEVSRIVCFVKDLRHSDDSPSTNKV